MKPSILINLFALTPSSATGVFVYVDNLIEELTRLDASRIYWIAARDDTHQYFQNKLKNRANVKYVVFNRYSFFVERVAARLLKKRSIVEIAMRKRFQTVIDRNNIRIVFFPSGSLNPQGLRDVAIVVTLYDLQYEYFPDNFPPKYLKIRREGNRTAAEHADHILAISEFTKKSLIEKYGINDDKITVTYLASQVFHEAEPIPLPKQFIFYPAGLWPHKNHLVLLKAFIMLKDKFPELHLVLTGIDKWHGILEEIWKEAEQAGVAGRIHYLGHVRNSVLHYIYKNAVALMFPSGFEGFGMPLAEAFSLGVPVIAANNSSIPEVVGDTGPVRNRARPVREFEQDSNADTESKPGTSALSNGTSPEDLGGGASSNGAGILVPTGNAKALADAIERMLIDEKLRSELIAKGYERARLFSWEKTARKTLDVFNKLNN